MVELVVLVAAVQEVQALQLRAQQIRVVVEEDQLTLQAMVDQEL
jgi:hypothetical protein